MSYAVPVIEEEIVVPDEDIVLDITEDYVVLDKYARYLTLYPEFVGWIAIEAANLNDPVVQSKDFNNPHFYLDKGPDRQACESGAIFLDTRNFIHELDRHTVIYGHNMADGTMFGSLDQYKNKTFRNENAIITFDTIYEEYTWEVVNVFVSNTDFYYIQTYFEDDNDFMRLMNECMALCTYDNDVVIQPTDKILTLSTCTNEIKDGRLVVQARLIESGDDVNRN